MKGQNRTLSIRMKGADVALRHQQLRRLGCTIPWSEIEKRTLVQAYKKAVLEVQVKHGLKGDGAVDEVTAL